MKIDGRTVTPNELAKIEILQALHSHIHWGDSTAHTLVDNERMTQREYDEEFQQVLKRHQSIRNLLGADKLNEKFKLNL